MQGSKISNALENKFFSFFYVLEIKEDYVKVEESKAVIRLHIVKIYALLRAVVPSGILLLAF